MTLKLDVTENDNLIWGWGTQQRHFHLGLITWKLKECHLASSYTLRIRMKFIMLKSYVWIKRDGERGEESGQIYKITLWPRTPYPPLPIKVTSKFIFLHCKVTRMPGEFWIYDLTLHPRGRGRAIRPKTPLE